MTEKGILELHRTAIGYFVYYRKDAEFSDFTSELTQFPHSTRCQQGWNDTDKCTI